MAQPLSNGVYVIRNAAYDDRVADLSDNNTAPETPIIGFHYHKGDNQQWELESVNGVNLYIIKNKLSSGRSYFALSSLKIYPHLIASQEYYEQWSIESVGEGYFRIHHPYQPTVATLSSEKERAQLTLEAWEGRQDQKWRFETV